MDKHSSQIELNLDLCWAKTYPKGYAHEGDPALSVREHCLTVGFVAKTLFDLLPERLQILLPEGTASLIAAHDIGKITPGFQLKCHSWPHLESVSQQLQPDGLTTNHALISQLHLQQVAKNWTISTAGHHGSYPAGWNLLPDRGRRSPSEGGLTPFFEPLRRELLQILEHHLGPLPSEPLAKYYKTANEFRLPDHARLHFLTGFTILADWIGSNLDWFPLDTSFSKERVVEKTSQIADELKLSPSIQAGLSFAEQFQKELPSDATPRPIQQSLLDAATEPGLYIVEAPMGMGKTEAALSAAYQLWQNQKAHGLYFALPTQLTSNRIHARIHGFLESVIDSDTFHSLIHGNAWLEENATRNLTSPLIEDDPNSTKTPELDHNDLEEASRWFSSTRKQLIAPFGTGTIDQALLSILPARFAALRHFALAGKVIVIDEVHSYDPYMSALIDRLIAYQLHCGSTIIILSATLTAASRQKLVEAAGASEVSPPNSYPLITKVATGEAQAEHFTVGTSLEAKEVHLEHHTLTGEDETYWQQIADYVEAGANVVVIRNTVALAQQTYGHLKSLLRENKERPVGLLHSRFPQWQRSHNEKHWVDQLGKKSDLRPSGSLLVSTQIVEQSVDIDADLLITDLAPTDLILQRIGRLHRHQTNNPRRPEPSQSPRCHLLHPDTNWQGKAKDIEQHLSPHHFIYHALSLWQAHQTLLPTEKICLPADIRPLLEASAALQPTADDSQGVRDFLEQSNRQLDQEVGTARTRNVFNSAISDQEGKETRYRIKPSLALVLLKQAPETRNGRTTITPLHQAGKQPTTFTIDDYQFSYPLTQALHLNAVQISRHLAQDLLSSQPTWLQNHMRDAVLAVAQEGTTELDLLDHPNSYHLHYHPDTGITAEKSDHTSSFTDEPAEDWY